MGLLGVLATASAQGQMDIGQAVERLRRTNFRVSPELLRHLLDQASRRRFESLLGKVPDAKPGERDRLD